MAKFQWKKVLYANNFEAESARRIAENLMRKYVLPNRGNVPKGNIFFVDTGWSFNLCDSLTAAIEVRGYFSQTKVEGYISPFAGEPIEISSEVMDLTDIVVRKKNATVLNEKALRKKTDEELDKIYGLAFDEMNFVAYSYEERRSPEEKKPEEEEPKEKKPANSLVSFKATFKFIS